MKKWNDIIEEERNKSYYIKLKDYIDDEYRHKTVYPEKENIFEALKLTPFDKVKVVIIGQDPYHGFGQAHGLSFSVKHGIKIPPSLLNIYKELHSEFGLEIGMHGYLENWARQGVLMLNTSLTVREHEPMSHANIGWEILTKKLITELSNNDNRIIFILLGRHAKQLEKYIDKNKNIILYGVHPSPLAASKGFFGSDIFKKTNNELIKLGKNPINWSIYKAMVFDLDGTLINTIASISKALNESLKAFGLATISDEKVQEFVGDGIENLIIRTLNYIDEDVNIYLTKLKDELMRNFDRYTLYGMEIYKNFDKILNILKKYFILGVYTNKPEEVARKVIDSMLPNTFSFVLGNNPNEEIKPGVKYLAKELKKYHIDLQDVIYIGDSDTDMKTAKNGNMKCVAVSWGFRGLEVLESYKPDRIIDDPKELLSEIGCEWRMND